MTRRAWTRNERARTGFWRDVELAAAIALPLAGLLMLMARIVSAPWRG